jgi:glycosyltransferase involved in cell wall biosynthesis
MKKKIFLLYPYYYPHYKAGGPVQSIYNLAGYFRNEAAFFFVSLNRDIDDTHSEIPVVCGSWLQGPQGENVYYTSKFSFGLIRKQIKEVKPDVVFVNGLFNISTTLPGVLCAKWYGAKLVISSRGMLQAWALKLGRPWLKKIFIHFLKAATNKKTIWHATDELEKNDIRKYFGNSAVVHVASNIPRALIDFTQLAFHPGNDPVRIVFLSLINPNKNLHLIIDAVNQLHGKFILDIYGPVTNQTYWQTCKEKIGIDNPGISYKGPVMPWRVQDILKQYHFFILPTEGENFGHAIFDALSSSVPVIISRNTPWTGIDVSGAGFYMDLNGSSLSTILAYISTLSEDSYQRLRRSARLYATNFVNSKNYSSEYQFLLRS